MTSLAFILGVVPLIVSTGAGAEMRRALGMAVFSGMLGVTMFGIVLTPVFFFMHRLAWRTPGCFGVAWLRKANAVAAVRSSVSSRLVLQPATWYVRLALAAGRRGFGRVQQPRLAPAELATGTACGDPRSGGRHG